MEHDSRTLRNRLRLEPEPAPKPEPEPESKPLPNPWQSLMEKVGGIPLGDVVTLSSMMGFGKSMLAQSLQTTAMLDWITAQYEYANQKSKIISFDSWYGELANEPLAPLDTEPRPNTYNGPDARMIHRAKVRRAQVKHLLGTRRHSTPPDVRHWRTPPEWDK